MFDASREHREFGAVHLPEAEGGQECSTKEKRDKDVSRCPWVLVASPLKSRKEQNHAANAEQAADVIDLFQDLASWLAKGVDTRWWKVKEQCHQEANAIPCADNGADVSPVGIVCEQISQVCPTGWYEMYSRAIS